MRHLSITVLTRSAKIAIHSAIILLCTSFFCHAEVYKWTDKHGNTHYSDIKPNNTNSEKLRIKTTQATNSKDPITSANELGERNEQALKEKSEQLRASTEKRELEARCEAIRSNLKTIQENSRIKINENGETRFLTPEEIATKTQSYSQQLKDHCN